MLTISTTLDDGSFRFLQLPLGKTWTLRRPRITTSKPALDGHTIFQTAIKQPGSGEMAWAARISREDADLLREIDEGASGIFLSDGEHLYAAIMDATIGTGRGSPVDVSVSFQLVRRIL